MHQTQTNKSLMFLHILTHSLVSVLLNRPIATWNLFVLYNDQKRKKRQTNASYRLTVRGFVDVSAFS